MKHNLELQICLDDLAHPRNGIKPISDMIKKVKAAVFAKSGKVTDVTFDNKPDPVHNPDGNIGTLHFAVATPYFCNATLEIDHRMTVRNEVYPLIEMKVTFQ